MKQLPWLVIGVVVGFLLGGLGPRRELAERDARISELQERLVKEQNRAGRGRLLGATPLPALEDALAGDHGPATRHVERPAPARGGEGEGDFPGLQPALDENAIEPLPPEDPLAAFDLAADAQRLRARQSREALREQAGLNAEQLGRLDDIVADMNQRLGEHADDLLDLALAGEQPETSTLLGVTHDVTGILYDSQTRLESLVGEQAMAEADPTTTEIWNYVDLEVFRAAVEEAGAAGALDGLEGRSEGEP